MTKPHRWRRRCLHATWILPTAGSLVAFVGFVAGGGGHGNISLSITLMIAGAAAIVATPIPFWLAITLQMVPHDWPPFLPWVLGLLLAIATWLAAWWLLAVANSL